MKNLLLASDSNRYSLISFITKYSFWLFVFSFSGLRSSFAQSPPYEKVVSSTNELNDLYGWTVALSEDHLVVSASETFVNGWNRGAVYIYKKDMNGNWGNEQKLIASDTSSLFGFGYSIDIHGDNMIVSGGGAVGSAWVYEMDDTGTWGNEHKLALPDTIENYSLGGAVGIYNDFLFVSGSYDAESVVYVFQENSNGEWGYTQKIVASDSVIDGGYGISLCVHNNHLLVGSTNWNDNGAVYVYEKNTDGVWGSEQKIEASDFSVGDGYGYSIDIFEDVLVVGASTIVQNGQFNGGAYVYQKSSDGFWGDEQKINPFSAQENSAFGSTVGVHGDRLVISDLLGAIYVYEKDLNGNWFFEQQITVEGEYLCSGFNESIDISDTHVVGGAPKISPEVGSAYVFNMENPTSSVSLNASSSILYQNTPNPFSCTTTIGFELESATVGKISITDMNGRLIKVVEDDFLAGYNEIIIEDFNSRGVFYYTIETDTFIRSKKMIAVD